MTICENQNYNTRTLVEMKKHLVLCFVEMLSTYMPYKIGIQVGRQTFNKRLVNSGFVYHVMALSSQGIIKP